MPPREVVARRIKAAQALGGFTNTEDLATATKAVGNLGLKRVRELQQQRGDEARVVELRTIAEACGLPFEFFTIDFARLAPAGQADERLAELEERIRQLEAGQAAPAPPGELGRRAEGSGPTGGHRPQDKPREERGRVLGAEG